MAGTTITMTKLKQIISLKNRGTALQTISKAVGVSRNTVKKYIRLIEVKGYSLQDLLDKEEEELQVLLEDPAHAGEPRLEALRLMFPAIERELQRTGVNRWILWGEYRLKHPDGYSYSQYCDHLSQWLKSKSATMHLEHTPADKMYIDFAGKKLQVVDTESGELTDVEVYVAILGYSQLTYVEAIPSQKKEDFIKATENALHYFGGVPKVMVPDNLKSAVKTANKYEADINADFLDLANHYKTSVLPTRSYRPRDKALVEGAVKIAYSRIYAPLRDRVFYSLTELNEAIRDHLELHNTKGFKGTSQTRRNIFEAEERHLLLPLAATRFELKKFGLATVMKNGHVRLSEDKHYYSVPYRYIGSKVKVIYTSDQVSVYYQGERVCYHKRNMKNYGYTTLKDHMPSAHQFVSDWNADKFIKWASAIDEKVKEYILKILDSKNYPEQTYRTCVGILSQEKKVGKQRLIAAIERAVHYQVYSYKVIDNILKNGLDKLEEQQDGGGQLTFTFHENIRGPKDYK